MRHVKARSPASVQPRQFCRVRCKLSEPAGANYRTLSSGDEWLSTLKSTVDAAWAPKDLAWCDCVESSDSRSAYSFWSLFAPSFNSIVPCLAGSPSADAETVTLRFNVFSSLLTLSAKEALRRRTVVMNPSFWTSRPRLVWLSGS